MYTQPPANTLLEWLLLGVEGRGEAVGGCPLAGAEAPDWGGWSSILKLSSSSPELGSPVCFCISAWISLPARTWEESSRTSHTVKSVDNIIPI